MADDTKLGTTWKDDELDAVVADYFSMLMAELSGKAYTKSRHSASLMARIGRTHRSVEFKHQNISAVLEEMGMPWIRGYKPKRNYQNAIFDAIDRYLTTHPDVLTPAQAMPEQPLSPDDVFVAPPVPSASKRLPARLRQLVGRFDPVERDRRNRSLGKAGESFVFELEKRRLFESDRKDLATKVRWISREEGDGAGYDVLSFEATGQSRLIEVKTTNGSARTPFFLSRNEFQLAKERAVDWRIYRVYSFSAEPRIFTIRPPLEDALRLSTQTWRASF